MENTNIEVFNVGGKIFRIERSKIPKDSLLMKFITTDIPVKRKNGKIVIDLSPDDFKHIYRFLIKGTLPPLSSLATFDYLRIPELSNYELATVRENYMRRNMYKPKFASSRMNREPHYNLVKIDRPFWETLNVCTSDRTGDLFPTSKLIKREWSDVEKMISDLNFLPFGKCPMMVAGGRIFSSLFQCESSDIDIFMIGNDDDVARTSILEKLIPCLNKKYKTDRNLRNRVFRTENTFSFVYKEYNENKHKTKEYQIVLRLYKTYSEILHGFDVDCCSIGYDGKDIWITQRALFSIMHGYNTINFERMSPSYQYRLVKYAIKGMSIRFPSSRSFDRSKIDKDAMVEYMDKNYPFKRTSYLKGINGASFLVFMEFYMDKIARNRMAQNFISKLDKENSDYNTVPIIMRYTGREAGSFVEDTICHLIQTCKTYKESSKKYMPLLRKLLGPELKENGDEVDIDLLLAKTDIDVMVTNSFLVSNTISYISTSVDYTKSIIDINNYLYDAFAVIRPWKFPRLLSFKMIKPGEQMTNTFNVMVVNDPDEWYIGPFYKG